MSRHLRLAVAVATLCVLGLMTACSTGAAPESEQDASGTANADSLRAAPAEPGTGDPTPSPSPAPTPPPDPGCYRLTFRALPEPTSSEEPVACRSRHTAQTIHVGELDRVVEGHALALDSEHVRDQLTTICPRRLARFVGGSAEDRRLSRFEVVWFSPPQEAADGGAGWFRCDVVALARAETLHPLPPPGRLEGVLDRRGALATYGLCGTAAPGAPEFSRVICARKHRWRAISTIPLTGGEQYPGRADVRCAGDSACRDQARAQADDPLRFRYGWEWPTRDQWRAGQHYGYCWMPD